MQLTWRVSSSTSALHAADLLRGDRPLADRALEQAMAPAAARLQEEIAGTGVPPDFLWQQLVMLAAELENNRELALRALTKAGAAVERREELAQRLAGPVADSESALRSTHPSLERDLMLRVAPLREQWEARGPGLLHLLGRLTEPDLIAEQAQVILVHPAAGGGGRAHLPYNAVRLEAVLVNPVAQLPEVVRLAWLLAQLQLDLPRLSERLTDTRLLPHLAQLAMLPAVLEAAQEVELTRYDQATIRLALASWHIDVASHEQVADVLERWWETYRESRSPFPLALQALEQMLA